MNNATHTEQEKVLEAVRKYALYYFDDRGNGIFTYQLDEQRIDYSGWNISPEGRVIHTIQDISIIGMDSKPEEGYYIVEVDAWPEVPDTHLFEANIDDAGNIAVSWYGC